MRYFGGVWLRLGWREVGRLGSWLGRVVNNFVGGLDVGVDGIKGRG